MSGNAFLYKTWRKYHHLKKKYHKILDEKIGTNKSDYRYSKIHITVFIKQKMDYDNVVVGCKPIIDWIKTRNYINDDSPDDVVLSFSQVIIDKTKNKYIQITLGGIF